MSGRQQKKARSRGALKLPTIYRLSLVEQIEIIQLGRSLSVSDVAKVTKRNHQSVKRLIEEGLPYAHDAPAHKCVFCLRLIKTSYCVACYVSNGVIDEYKPEAN